MSDGARRVLIVEDDPEILYLLSVILDEPDREVLTASTGAEAEAVLGSTPVDLVVLDLILPDADGRALLTELRARPETATVPVVVSTARSGAQIRQECYSLGADAFVEKPFDPEVVAADIAARLQRPAGRPRAGLHDPVTGLLNRAGLMETYAEGSAGSVLALVQLEERGGDGEGWGGAAVEPELQAVGNAIRTALPEGVRAGRIGGGDFVLQADFDAEEEMRPSADAVLEEIRALTLPDGHGGTRSPSASIGVVRLGARTSLDDALHEARGRILRAREAGRNRVVHADETPEGSTRRVLVAEDDEISATILLHRLRKEGLDVTHCTSGTEAWETAIEMEPDLVVLDVKMPGMDGFEVLERLRRNPSFSAIPIVMLTSMGSEADVVRGFQLGADDYVLKPFSPTEVSARVWRMLRRGRASSAV
jgi:DNA-binding response OmpR family regulator